LANQREGVYTFRVNGCIYHRIGSLLPNDDNQAKFGQIYFCDEDSQERIRSEIFPSQLSNWLIRQIQNILFDINPYAIQFKMAATMINNSPTIDLRIAIHNGKTYTNDETFLNPAANHPRRYNKPTVQEVAAIVVGSDEDRLKLTREILLYKQEGGLKIISDDHPSYDPLHYVLMFPYGQNGWAPDTYLKYHQNNEIANINQNNNLIIEQNLDQINNNYNNNLNEEQLENDDDDLDRNAEQLNANQNRQLPNDPVNDDVEDEEYGNDAAVSSHQSKYVSCAEFYSYKLMRREDSGLHLLRNLYQQYVVDNYLKVEHQKLKWAQFNQAKLRCELYKGLVDSMNRGDTDLNNTGKKVILPSTFVGGPRYMINLFQDSMAIVRQFKKPDLFCTVTCNPKWSEIVEKLAPGQKPQDQPDMVSRVFKLKLKAIMEQILNNHVLGHVVAHMYVIEFQKRVTKFSKT
jgi:hypothetical protein